MKIGMSAQRLAFITSSASLQRNQLADEDRPGDSCEDAHFFIRDAPPETSGSAGPFHWSQFGAQFQAELVQRIDIMHGTQAQTEAGVHLGSTEEELKRAYANRLQEGPWTAYGANTELARDPGRTGAGHAFLLKSPGRNLAMLFETDGVQVNVMHVGVAKYFKVSTLKGASWMPEGAIYAVKCEELMGAEHGRRPPTRWMGILALSD